MKSILICVLTLPFLSFSSPSIAQGDKQVKFYCGRTQDIEKRPATIATIRGVQGGEVNIVIWSNFKNISAEKRCEAASKRFQEAWDRGNFNAIGSGVNENGLGLICALSAKGQICDSRSMLFTLKNGLESKDVVDGLQRRLRRNIGNPPVYQSSDGFPSIDIQDLIKSLSTSEK